MIRLVANGYVMPRRIDFDRGNESEWNEVLLPEPVYGDREIGPEEAEAALSAFAVPINAFEPQFSTYGLKDPADRTTSYGAAHSWLSANATGPWSWDEDWSNHGHHVDVHVYVERTSDQRAFAAAYPELFKYRPSDDSALVRTATRRGVLPLLTARESFYVWSRERSGYDFLDARDLGENGWRVAVTHPEIERRFVEAWPAFARVERDGRTVHEGVVEPGRRWDASLSVWFDRNAGLSSISGGNGPDGYRYTVETRYPDVADALERDWGHFFVRGPDGSTFHTEDYPSSPERGLPADFRAYLEGETESYEAPHLPEALRPFREEASGPTPG